ncbi:MAG: hypothetical protein ABJF10_03215 [Chthoniobacter sp.]|uniref:hypothetical protein n=1 Tax=Chthoniobacter sp. TaxID=2510640 RepID=UPI0032ADE0AA
MTSPLPLAPAKTSSQRWIVIVLVVLLCGGVIASGYLFLRNLRAQREAAVQHAKTPPPANSDDAVAARALSNYLARIRAQFRDHDADFLRLQQQKALSWNIHSRADIERDRKIIHDFLTTNTRLTETLRYGEGFIRAELNSAKVPAAIRDSAVDLYAKSQGPLLPLQIHVRQCDQVIGENALAVLDLLDFNWGAWGRDEATGRLDFTNTITLATFRDYVGKIEAAAAEREDAQQQLTRYQERRRSP